MNALPKPLWACTDPDAREQLDHEVAIDRVAAKLDESDTAEIIGELLDAQDALAWIAANVDLPLRHLRAYRAVLDRAVWLERLVEAEL